MALEITYFTVIVVHLGCLMLSNNEVDAYAPGKSGFFNNDRIFTSSSSKNLSVRNMRHPLILGEDDCVRPIKSSCNKSSGVIRDKLSRIPCHFHHTMMSLRHCGWRHSVVLISDTSVGNFGNSESKCAKNGSTTYNSNVKAHRNSSQCRKITHNRDITYRFLEALYAVNLPVQHFQLSPSTREDRKRELEEIIWTSYESGRVRNFVWISSRPWEIMDAAQAVFRRQRRGRGALMVHRARFVLIGVDSLNIYSSPSSSSSSSSSSSPSTSPSLPSSPSSSSQAATAATTAATSSSSSSSSSVAAPSPLPLLSPPLLPIMPLTKTLDQTKPFTSLHSRHSLTITESALSMLKETETQLATSEFDNVFYFHSSNEYTDSDDLSGYSCSLSLLNTLRWRANRSREFEPVPNVQVFSRNVYNLNRRNADVWQEGNSCKLYPHIHTGMNGRHLDILAKNWGHFLEVNDEGDPIRFSGFLVEVANALSVSMNFTYTIRPDPMVSQNMTWNELENIMLPGGVGDCLLSLYYITASLAYNFSLTYPILYANMTGAYILKPHAEMHLFFSGLDPLILVYSVTAFGLVLLLYSGLYSLSKKWCCDERSSEARQFPSSTDPWNWQYYVHRCWLMLFPLLGSCFSQGNVPQPMLFSGRILLFAWCVTALTLTAALQGHLASSLVKAYPSPPFTNFRELLHRTDYRWGHYKSSTFLPVMAADKNSTLSKLYSGMMRFALVDPEVLAPDIEASLLKAARDEKFVAIVDSFLMRHFVYSNGIRNMKTISDSLGTNGLALVVPPDSELEELMSEHIIALSDAGIFNLLADKMYQRLEANFSNNISQINLHDNSFESPDEKASYKIDVRWGLVLCGFLVLTATVVLVMESFVACWKLRWRALMPQIVDRLSL